MRDSPHATECLRICPSLAEQARAMKGNYDSKSELIAAYWNRPGAQIFTAITLPRRSVSIGGVAQAPPRNAAAHIWSRRG